MKKLLFFTVTIFSYVFAQSQIITTYAGDGAGGFYLGDNIPATTASLWLPEGGLALDTAGNLYIPDYTNNRVRKVNKQTGIITTIAGTGPTGFSGDGGLGTNAKLYGPCAVAVDVAGNVYIADYSNNRIRKVTASTGIITTFAGTGAWGYTADGALATLTDIKTPTGLAVDSAGNVYYSDMGSCVVRKISKTTGLVSTIAGIGTTTGTCGYNGDNIAATSARLDSPMGLDVDFAGNIYIADRNNYRVRKVTASSGLISTVSGNGVYGNGGDGGLATSASLKEPYDVDADSVGNLYIADRFDHKVRKVNTGGIINVIAGTGTQSFNGDNIPATTAHLSTPSGVCVDKCDAVYITDRGNNRIRKITSYSVTVSQSSITCNGLCNGVVNASASGGNGGYTYSWTPLGAGPTHSNVCAGTYSLKVNDSKGCGFVMGVTVGQPSALQLNLQKTNATCGSNGSATVNPLGGTGPYTYTWSNGGTNISTSGLSIGAHSVTIADANGCSLSGTFSIVYTGSLTLLVGGLDATCKNNGGANTVVSGSTSVTYSWSTGATTSSITNLAPGTYTVTIQDGNGCKLTGTCSVNYNPQPYSSTPICLVTVDSTSTYNIITWDKSSSQNVDSFFVYRETGTNIYQIVGAQKYSALSQFVDTVRVKYFPNTGDPNVGTYRYKIKVRDTCGNYSQFSPYHNTLFTTGSGGTFTWPQLYTIEGGANPVSSYVLMRDNFSNGNWVTVNSVSGTQQFIIDPNYSNFASTASWRIKTQWSINCVPSLKWGSQNFYSGFSASYSNITGKFTSIKESKLVNTFKVYPNPSSGQINLVFVAPLNNATLKVVNVLGQTVSEKTNLNGDKITVDVSNQANGVYFIEVIGPGVYSRVKVVRE